MKDERRDEMMRTEDGRHELRAEMLRIMKSCIDDLIELDSRDALASSVAFVELEEAEGFLLTMVGEADPGSLLQEIRQLTGR